MSRETRMRHWARIGMVVAVSAGISAAFTTLALAQSTASTTAQATHTSLTVETREVAGQTIATIRATVQSSGSRSATGAITLMDQNTGRSRALAGAALDADGNTEIQLSGLEAGDHTLKAVYNGDGANAASESEGVVVHPQATATPDFTLAIAPATLTIKQGNAGTLVATVTPVNSFTGFISLSCSGAPATSGTAGGTSLPVGVSCKFSPANVQVSAPTASNPTGALTSNMTLQTTKAGGPDAMNQLPVGAGDTQAPLVLAILLPGIVGLGFLGRKRKLFKSTALLLAVGVVGLLGTSACSARYRYFNHGPTFGGTPTGTFTLTVTAQTSNGVNASSHSTALALTVN